MRVRRCVPDLHVKDSNRSKEFYMDVLGLEVGMDMGWIVTFGSTSNETAQISVMETDLTAPIRPDVTVEVEDVDTVFRRANERGFEVVHPLTDEPWGRAPLLCPGC